MASLEPEKKRKPGRRFAAWSQPRPVPEFGAKIVSVEAICAFSRANPAVDRAVAWVAQQQLGVVTTRQLLAAGLSYDSILTRGEKGLLHRLHHGVYLWGQPAPPPGARELAGVLACGDSAVVSHGSAAALWGFAKPTSDVVDVTVVGGSRRSRKGLRVHRTATLHKTDRRLSNGIPATSPALTLLDFASEARGDELEQAIAEAYALGLASERELERVLVCHPHRAGAGLLHAELQREGGQTFTRSEAEKTMKRLLRAARLPVPWVNARVAGYEVDFLWREQGVIVEVDGYQYHGHRVAFERDRRKGLALEAAGYRVLRLSWRQLTEEPLLVAATLAVALRSCRAQH